jgi:hypothetical protein
LNGTKFDLILSAMRLLANSCAANALSLLVTRFLIFSATDGNFVFSKVAGIATEALPFINLNDVWIQSACRQFLWVNSSMDREFFHLVGCAEQ